MAVSVAEPLEAMGDRLEVGPHDGLVGRRDEQGVGGQGVSDPARLRGGRHREVEGMGDRHDEDPRRPTRGV